MEGNLKLLKKGFFGGTAWIDRLCSVQGPTFTISEKLGDKKPRILDLRKCLLVKDVVCIMRSVPRRRLCSNHTPLRTLVIVIVLSTLVFH